MILILGGTTEGRLAVDTLDRGVGRFYYSTRSDLQDIESRRAVRITGALDCDAMTGFCLTHGIKLLVDAAHPFATRLHSNVVQVSRRLSLPVIRLERRYPPRDARLTWCENFSDAVRRMTDSGITRLLALTGVQTISGLRDFWTARECFFRILHRPESLETAESAGFPSDHLIFYENDGDILSLIDKIHPDAIITKESGESGGFSLKVEEALQEGIKVFVIRRPPLPEEFEVVTGAYGLRKAVESHLPGFYELRSGFTTGACATAAAKAALLAIVNGEDSPCVSFSIPNGEVMEIKVERVTHIAGDEAEAVVVKDAGDDPDVTNGVGIVARVRLADHGKVRFFGGEGIGTVTLPGIGLEIGEPAINLVPREMMRHALLRLYPRGCDVTLSVPGGEELAKRTFNSRIGIVGGISVIGTSGIVMPYSNEAFIEAIRREMEVALAYGCKMIVLNSGAGSENAVKSFFPDLPPCAFIHYGNAVGLSLRMAGDLGIKRVAIGVMLGKAVKLAEGNLDTHSHKVTINRDFLALLAREAGCSPATEEIIRHLNMARELWTSLSPSDAALFFPLLLSKCKEVCCRCYAGDLQLMLVTDKGKIISQVAEKNK